ncbi:MAG: hypothetical protein KY442_12550 [Proteobacteria bacterium]|nr:hypothetical protein [Pseudomonadota bacterium]
MQRLLRRLSPSSGFVIGGLIASAAWGTVRPLDLLPVELLAVAAVLEAARAGTLAPGRHVAGRPNARG